MNLKHLSLALLLTFSFSSLQARENKTEKLEKEVQELKKTVEDLKSIVEQQNEKINTLTSKKKIPLRPIESKQTPELTRPPEINLSQTRSAANSESRSLGAYKYSINPNNAQRLLPDISVIGVISGAYFQQEPSSLEEAHGHDPHRTGFNLQEIEVAFQSIIDPYVRADVFLSFHEEGVEVEEAYLTTLSLPKGLQVKAGKYLQPFGRQNQKHLERWAFANNNLINKYFLGEEGYNELGLEVSYLAPTSFFLQGQFSFSQGNNEGNFDGTRKQDFAYTGRVSTSVDLNDHWTALWGASTAFGFNQTGLGNSTLLLGGDFLLKWNPSANQGFEWQTEYIYRRRKNTDFTESEGGISSYALAQLNKRWGAGVRFDYLGLPVETEKTFRISPLVSLNLSEYFKLRAQYDYTKTIGGASNHIGILQLIFNMGPHGAHQF